MGNHYNVQLIRVVCVLILLTVAMEAIIAYLNGVRNENMLG